MALLLLLLLLYYISNSLNCIIFLCADNVIEDLPASICNLIHLKSLCLNNNNLSQVFTVQCKYISFVYTYDSNQSIIHLFYKSTG